MSSGVQLDVLLQRVNMLLLDEIGNTLSEPIALLFAFVGGVPRVWIHRELEDRPVTTRGGLTLLADTYQLYLDPRVKR